MSENLLQPTQEWQPAASQLATLAAMDQAPQAAAVAPRVADAMLAPETQSQERIKVTLQNLRDGHGNVVTVPTAPEHQVAWANSPNLPPLSHKQILMLSPEGRRAYVNAELTAIQQQMADGARNVIATVHDGKERSTHLVIPTERHGKALNLTEALNGDANNEPTPAWPTAEPPELLADRLNPRQFGWLETAAAAAAASSIDSRGRRMENATDDFSRLAMTLGVTAEEQATLLELATKRSHAAKISIADNSEVVSVGRPDAPRPPVVTLPSRPSVEQLRNGPDHTAPSPADMVATHSVPYPKAWPTVPEASAPNSRAVNSKLPQPTPNTNTQTEETPEERKATMARLADRTLEAQGAGNKELAEYWARILEREIAVRGGNIKRESGSAYAGAKERMKSDIEPQLAQRAQEVDEIIREQLDPLEATMLASRGAERRNTKGILASVIANNLTPSEQQAYWKHFDEQSGLRRRFAGVRKWIASRVG